MRKFGNAVLVQAGLVWRHRNKNERGNWDSTSYEILFDDPGVLAPQATGVLPPQATGVARAGNRGVACGGTGVLPVEAQGCCLQRHTEQSHLTESKNSRRDALCAEASAIDWFERFWQAYPSRGEHPNPKKPAKQKFQAALKSGVNPA